MTQQHGIAWGAIDCVDPTPTADGYVVEVSADGTNFGNPKAIIQVVRSLLTDGSLAVLEGWDNREIPLHVRISAPDATAGPALAAGEAAIMAELRAESKSPLIYVPPADDGPTCVFDVVIAELNRTYETNYDLDEVTRRARCYEITLTCLPFARPEDTTIASALAPAPPSPTVVDIDDCTSTTGWAVVSHSGFTINPTASVSSGAVTFTGQTDIGSLHLLVRRTGSVSMGATPYLRLSIKESNPSEVPLHSISVWNGATNYPLPILAILSSAIAGVTDYYVQPPVSSITAIDIRWQGTTTIVQNLYGQVHHVARTDLIPGSGTTRQQSRTATVSGSAPTQAAIRLFDATPAALGTEILVHTSRNTAWTPSLRSYRTSSATVTTDTAMVSGARNTLASSMVFRIPANLMTEGTYSLMARLNVSTGGTFGWSAKMVSSAGATTVGSSVVTSGSVTVGVTSGYQVINLAALPLPVVRAEADQMVELTLTGTSNMTVDEVWLFGLHDGVLTWLRDADSLTWIEIRSPELGAARPSIYGGTGAKGANSIDVSWKAAGATYGSFGAHRFDPGLMQIFTVTSTSLVSQSEIEFYPRYHSHVEAA